MDFVRTLLILIKFPPLRVCCKSCVNKKNFEIRYVQSDLKKYAVIFVIFQTAKLSAQLDRRPLRETLIYEETPLSKD